MNERNDKTLRASPVAGLPSWLQRLAERKWPRAIIAACGMALLLSATTALGTASLPFFGRTAYWLMEMLLGAAVIGAILWLLRSLPRQRLYLRAALVALISVPLITLVVWATTEPIKGKPLRWERTLEYLPGILPITGFNAFMQIVLGRKELADRSLPLMSGSQVSPKQSELELYAIEAQAHYVILHTSTGPVKKLMRFYEAISSAARTTNGLQVHRSWWVALSAVADFDGRKRKVVLVNGLQVPVSRSKVSAAAAVFENPA